jgi:hypothetical protein
MGLSSDPKKAANQLQALAAGRVKAARALLESAGESTAEPGQSPGSSEPSPSAAAVDRVRYTEDQPRRSRSSSTKRTARSKAKPGRRAPSDGGGGDESRPPAGKEPPEPEVTAPTRPLGFLDSVAVTFTGKPMRRG